MDAQPGYLVRYGAMGHVGRFPGPAGGGEQLERGQTVVVRTDRGLELGEVLLGLGGDRSWRKGLDLDSDRPRVLRPAGPDDLNSHCRSEALRAERFAACRQVLDEAGWELELLDVELLLDQNMMVLHVLGPGDLDLALLRARVRSRLDFDVVFEPVGSEIGLGRQAGPASASASQGRCGDCDCGEGGCGSAADRASVASAARGDREADGPADSCATSSHSACSSCGVTRWLAGKRPVGV